MEINHHARLKEENERLREQLRQQTDPHLGVKRGFIEDFRERQDLLLEPPEQDASQWWLLLPLYLLGAGMYTFYSLLHLLATLIKSFI